VRKPIRIRGGHIFEKERTMRSRAVLAAVLVGLSASAELAAENQADKKAGATFEELFNGRDLTGWKGDERVWSVEDGLLTGQTTGEVQLEHNTFAIWTGGEVEDFVLRVQFRLEGDNNSGVQYRSRLHAPNGPFAVVGYQADIHPAANYTGMLYDEGGRGIAAERGQHVTFAADGQKEARPLQGKFDAVDLTKWNRLQVRAIGNRLVHKLNGKVTVRVIDKDAKQAERKGLLALQVHAGPPMKVQFKSIKLRRLSAAGAKREQAAKIDPASN
jgi:hypothetical protein